MVQRFVDAAAVEAEIERVRSLSGAVLRRRWQAEFGRPLPKSLTLDLLRRMIGNRIQEQAFGTLDRATLKLLDGLARRGGARRGERNLKIGTVLVRDYQGRRHAVTVAPDGYVWEGTSYSSLSAIARAIRTSAWRQQNPLPYPLGYSPFSAASCFCFSSSRLPFSRRNAIRRAASRSDMGRSLAFALVSAAA
jgi:hypothetical protein